METPTTHVIQLSTVYTDSTILPELLLDETTKHELKLTQI